MSDREEVIKDDAYWADVRASLGCGTISILFGTSKRSLDKAVRRLREAYERKENGT